MKARLYFTQTQYDQNNIWRKIRTVDVELPEWITDKWDEFEWHFDGIVAFEEVTENEKTA